MMPKRKLDADAPLKEQFQALRQVPSLSHTQCRSVMELLNVDKVETGKRSCTRKEQLYPEAARALRRVTVCGENKELTLLLFSVVECTQNKLNSCPFFHDCLAEAVQANNYELELVVSWDEIVPGNVLAPDLRRKAAATYFAYADVAALWADTSWMTLSLTRSQELQGMPQGYARSMSAILETLWEETKAGFMLEFQSGPCLVHLRKISLLADADGLRLLLGAEGASGLKPCFRCSNVVGGDHTELGHHEHISSCALEKWEAHTVVGLNDIVSYLHDLPNKTAVDKAETLLGWNCQALSASLLVNPTLRDIVNIADCLYDPMHCFVSNGIVCQELGLWHSALAWKTNISLKHLLAYAKDCWKDCPPEVKDMDKLFSAKLWVDGKDFRGDASETLDVLPLCLAFSHEIVLPTHPEMRDEIKSLSALAAVIATWLRAKRDNAMAMVSRMRREQREHVLSFVKCYGENLVRPKLHYSLHLPDQWQQKKKTFDAFATERKHQYYKSRIAPRLKQLRTLSMAALLEMGENDLKIQEHDKALSTQLLRGNATSLSDRVQEHMKRENWIITKQLQHRAVVHGQGDYKILPDGTALEIVGAAERKHAFYLLGKPLKKEKEIAPTFTCWSRLVTQTQITLLPVEELPRCDNAAFYRKECTDTKQTVFLLLG